MVVSPELHVLLSNESRTFRLRNEEDALIKLTGDCNASVLANSAENEALIGRPHLRGAREVWFVATANVCFRCAHITAAFLTIKLIGDVSPKSAAFPGKSICAIRDCLFFPFSRDWIRIAEKSILHRAKFSSDINRKLIERAVSARDFPRGVQRKQSI